MKWANTVPPPEPCQVKSELPSVWSSAAFDPGSGAMSGWKTCWKIVGAPSMREKATLRKPAAASTSGTVPPWPNESGSHAAVGDTPKVSSLSSTP